MAILRMATNIVFNGCLFEEQQKCRSATEVVCKSMQQYRIYDPNKFFIGFWALELHIGDIFINQATFYAAEALPHVLGDPLLSLNNSSSAFLLLFCVNWWKI